MDRMELGLYSLDKAFINRKGEFGLPLGKGMELFGKTGIGKSTIAYGLSGIVAKHLGGNIALADLEGFDPDFLSANLENVNFSGTVQYIQRDKDEDVLDELVKIMKTKEYSVGILDSIGAISPISEQKSDIGEANMGRRAFAMAQHSRKMLKVLRDNPNQKCLIMTNHAYPKIGGFGFGLTTPGGVVKNFLASIRIRISRRWLGDTHKWQYPDGSYIVEGIVEKNRWGLSNKTFVLFILSGKGIHYGMTAIHDCENEKLLTIERQVVKIGDKSYGRLKPIIDKAQEGDEEFFQPFYDLLKGNNKNDK